MNHHQPHPDDDALAARLRQLPGHRVPPADGWAKIAARIADEAPRRSAAPATRTAPPRPLRWRTPTAWAAAASVALLAWVLAPGPAPVQTTPAAAPPLLVQQADAMSGEYRQAIAALPAAEVPAELRPALQELDASAAAIRTALGQQPDAGFLLGQLQRTYAKRLELTRMVALPAPADTTT